MFILMVVFNLPKREFSSLTFLIYPNFNITKFGILTVASSVFFYCNTCHLFFIIKSLKNRPKKHVRDVAEKMKYEFVNLVTILVLFFNM